VRPVRSVTRRNCPFGRAFLSRRDSRWAVAGRSCEIGNGCYRFQAVLHPAKSGYFGYALRILPHHPDAVTPFMPGLITWANDAAVNELEAQVK
jgi:hypothetical protein